MRFFIPLALSFCCLGVSACRLAESSPGAGGITVDWIYSEEGKSAAAVPSFAWFADGTAILHDQRRPESERTLERFDPASRKRTDLVDAVKALERLEDLLVRAAASPSSPREP